MSKRQPTAAAGKKLGRYVIERELGRGGMGVVYLALDENLGRRVALKTTSVTGTGAAARNQRRARFVREVKALAHVSHPNVVHVFDAGEADDPDLGWLLHYSMEYVEGITLAQLVHRQGALAPDAAAAVCMQVASGLGAAHVQGIIHRDVKPANIFLTTDARALIGDFGICKIEGSTQITRRDQLVGTPNYLAPEQILGDDISPATDVFALGALFYVIATNSPMRGRLDASGLLQAAQTNESRDKALALSHLPDGLRKVLARALERDPKDRYDTGTALAEALSEFASRIPPLDNTAPAPEPTRDNMLLAPESGTFAPLSDTPSPTGSVEEVARALLNQVESGSAKEAAPKKKTNLPVGKSESTVMFNIRQMEDEDDDEEASATIAEVKKSLELPVAQTESTMMFNIRQMENDEGRSFEDAPVVAPPPTEVRTSPMPSVGGGAVTSTTGPATPATVPQSPSGGAPSTPAFVFDNEASVDAAAPQGIEKERPVVKVIAPPVAEKSAGPSMAGRVVFAAVSAFAGAIGGMVVLFILGALLSSGDPNEVELLTVGEKKAKVETEDAMRVPSICADATKSKSGRDGSDAAVRRANQQLAKNRYSEAEKQADKAVALNPGNQAAHYAKMKVFFAKGGGNLDEIRTTITCAYVLDKRSEMGLDAKRRLNQMGTTRGR